MREWFGSYMRKSEPVGPGLQAKTAGNRRAGCGLEGPLGWVMR